MPELGIYLGIYGPADMGRHVFLFLHREKAVGIDAYHDSIGLYLSEGSLHASPSAADIVAVEGLGETIIGVCIESVYQLFSLILLV